MIISAAEIRYLTRNLNIFTATWITEKHGANLLHALKWCNSWKYEHDTMKAEKTRNLTAVKRDEISSCRGAFGIKDQHKKCFYIFCAVILCCFKRPTSQNNQFYWRSKQWRREVLQLLACPPSESLSFLCAIPSTQFYMEEHRTHSSRLLPPTSLSRNKNEHHRANTVSPIPQSSATTQYWEGSVTIKEFLA